VVLYVRLQPTFGAANRDPPTGGSPEIITDEHLRVANNLLLARRLADGGVPFLVATAGVHRAL